MPHFPMFVDLTGKPILIVGGGAVALRKLRKLAPYGGILTVIAPEILPEIADMPGLRLYRRKFRAWDLHRRPALVIAATNDPAANSRISTLCRRKRIPVNVVDDPARCSFLFPALVRQGNFSAGISTGGASPTAAVYFKEQLQARLPERLDEILAWLDAQRPLLKEAIPEQSRRAGVLRGLFDACVSKGAPLTPEEAEIVIGEKPMGSVALVGAGCGKADLITLRGLRLLQQCQAVVYDDLIDPALLEAAPESARRIYMGKRSGAHSAPQDEINRKLVELAQSGLRVVRLKGGDPYLFGRGGEEMLALRSAGIPCQEVPGIPSAIGIPAEAGIPVTHRGASRGLHIITAHTSDTPDGLPGDFDRLAGLPGTLVFLMGLKQLPTIAERLMAAGKSGDTPAAVLSGGNAPHPATVRTPLCRLAQAAREARVVPPAIILVGAVAALDLSAGDMPLAGVRVGVTGTDTVADKQRAALEGLGAQVLRLSRSVVAERPLPPDFVVPAEKPCWLVFTSANGVHAFFRQVSPADVAGRKFAVIGGATGKALAQYGIRADLCPETFTSQALATALAATARPGEEILLLRSSVGSPVLPRVLTEAGFPVRDIPIYDLEPAEATVPPLPELDYLTFSSSGGVELFFRQYGAVPEGVRCVCIGGVTAGTLARHMGDGFLTAGEISVPGMVNTILADFLSA